VTFPLEEKGSFTALLRSVPLRSRWAAHYSFDLAEELLDGKVKHLQFVIRVSFRHDEMKSEGEELYS
jgi:hypothetical protein